MDDRFTWDEGDVQTLPDDFLVVARDVLKPASHSHLYAVVIRGRGKVGALDRQGVTVGGDLGRQIADVEGQPSLLFQSADLEVRHAEMEDDGVEVEDDDYVPYIPGAMPYDGPITLGPERVIP